MKKLALTIAAAAAVAVAILWLEQMSEVREANRQSQAPGSALKKIALPTLEKSTAAPDPSTLETSESHPARTESPSIEAVIAERSQALLQDVALGRLALDSDEAELDTLDLAQTDAVPVIVRLWARKDRDAAARWVVALPESQLKSDAMRQLAAVFVQADVNAAVEWARDLTPGASRDAAIETVASAFSSSNASEAVALAETMSLGPTRDQTLVHALSQWAAQDPAGAVERAQAFNEPSLRSNALAAIAAAWATRDPGAAGLLAADGISDPVAQARAVVSVVQRWAESDPNSAAAWVAKFGPGPVSSNAIEQLVTLWSRQNIDAPRGWLMTLPDAGSRDAGLSALARNLGPSNSAEARRCALLISNPIQRQACLLALQNR